LLLFVTFVISLTLVQEQYSKGLLLAIKSLQNNDPTLQVLGLNNTNIGDECAECMANALAF